jgi:serine/threonine protein kinase
MAFLQKWFGKQDRDPLASRSDSEKALETWRHKFGVPQIRLVRSDPQPFVPGRRLGGGGAGIVYETHLDGVALALKRTYTHKLGERDLNEIKIMGQLSGKRHEHIVHLIGSYIHRQQSGYEIGLLISPVAHCDLACFMLKMDSLESWMKRPGSSIDLDLEDEAQSATELLSNFWKDSTTTGPKVTSVHERHLIHKASQRRICESFLCIASALEFLHRNNIRHRDLKPSQILLSPDGLWLTDFGYSNDMSAYSNSATSNWDTMTYRYQAPERAAKGSCSRPEDIFALGCTFLEMCIRLTNSAAQTVKTWKSSTEDKWSFQENLDDLHSWLAPLRALEDARMFFLASLISQMMEYTPRRRPKVEQVLKCLRQPHFGKDTPSCPLGSFFSSCCSPRYFYPSRGQFLCMALNNFPADLARRIWYFRY